MRGEDRRRQGEGGAHGAPARVLNSPRTREADLTRMTGRKA